MDTSTPLAKARHSLLLLGIRNAFKLGVFRELLTAADAAAGWRNLQRDLRIGRLIRAKVTWPSVFRLAARLSEQHSATRGTRSLDILHVATARTMGLTEFISFDARQRTLASDIGLKVAA